MINLSSEFISKFRLLDFEIKKVGSWIISLRPQQPTLGACVITLNRECEKLSSLTEKEGLELSLTFKEVERILAATFKPDKINYLALMMVDNQVHFHVLPRYEKKRSFEEVDFIDHSWPKPPSLESPVIEDRILQRLLEKMKSH